MSQRFMVIGAGRFGSSVAVTLSKNGYDVIVVDNDEDKIRALSDYVTHAIQMDGADEKSIKAIGIEDIDVVIVSIGTQLEASVLITMMLKEMGVKKVIAKAYSEPHGKILRRIGADKVIYPERDMGVRIAKGLISPSILDTIDISEDYTLIELNAPAQFYGKSLAELDIRTKYRVEIIAIRRKSPQINQKGESVLKDEMIVVPFSNEVISKGDVLLILGENESIEAFKEL